MTLNVGAVGDRYEDMAAKSSVHAAAYEACVPRSASLFKLQCLKFYNSVCKGQEYLLLHSSECRTSCQTG
jgi:hypothetical protein